MTTAERGCAVVVFAKAPVPGRVKTRLVPALGAEGAARLAQRFLAHTLAQAQAADAGPVALCVGGLGGAGAAGTTVRRLAHAAGVPLWPQSRGGLGRRMAQALARALQASPRAVLVGCDVPALDGAVLRAAAAGLADHDAVFGPTADGGYALIGLTRRGARHAGALFDGMRWSHPGVMQATRERAAAAGLRWAELPPLHDIDVPDDLVHLPPGWRQALS